MNILNKFIFELDYIIDIFDDIKKTYNDINDKKICMYKAYNKEDICLFIIVYIFYII